MFIAPWNVNLLLQQSAVSIPMTCEFVAGFHTFACDLRAISVPVKPEFPAGSRVFLVHESAASALSVPVGVGREFRRVYQTMEHKCAMSAIYGTNPISCGL